MHHSYRAARKESSGFTIVELLIVVTVIAILAAIVLVSYNGIRQRAIMVSLDSDLVNASSQIQTDHLKDYAYPTSVASADNGNGLKASNGAIYQYSFNNNAATHTFCLTAINGSVARYITNEGSLMTGICPGQAGSNIAGPNGGIVTTPMGGTVFGNIDGTGTGAGFTGPIAIAVDSSKSLYIADGNRIRKATSSGVVTTLAGSTAGYADATGTAAQFNNIQGIAVDSTGTVYVGDTGNNRIRKVTPAGVVSTLAGSISGFVDGTGAAARFNMPYGVSVDGSGNVYVADLSNNRIRKVSSAGVVTTLAGSGANGSANATGASASFWGPSDVATDSLGNVYVADSNNNLIRKITSAGVVTTLAGSTYGNVNTVGTSAQFAYPTTLDVDESGNVYVGDVDNSLIRKINSSGLVTTLAGSTYGSADGTWTAAQFKEPFGLAIDASNIIYVADYGIRAIRKIQ